MIITGRVNAEKNFRYPEYVYVIKAPPRQLGLVAVILPQNLTIDTVCVADYRFEIIIDLPYKARLMQLYVMPPPNNIHPGQGWKVVFEGVCGQVPSQFEIDDIIQRNLFTKG
jgi:hypothetical protein